HFIENSLGIELRFEALEGAINRLTFANDYFRHIFTYFPYLLRIFGGHGLYRLFGSESNPAFRLASRMDCFYSAFTRMNLSSAYRCSTMGFVLIAICAAQLRAGDLATELTSAQMKQIKNGSQVIEVEDVDGFPW